jgi:peptidase M23-like protein
VFGVRGANPAEVTPAETPANLRLFGRAPERPVLVMRRHRTTARGILFLAAIFGLAAGSAAAPAATAKVPRLIFPVVGQVTYTSDFGAPRSGGRHQGNDLMAPKKSPAVAAEAGKVKYWTTSATAGCMLYLYGESGTTYLYIHLNNDVTRGNDNRGKCVRGVSYTVKDGAKVAAGQQIGYVGDSGDANGGQAHLHFEVHPAGGKAVDPYAYLQAAQRLLFASKPGAPFALTLSGTVSAATVDRLTVTVQTSQAWPSRLTLTKLNQSVTLSVPATALVQSVVPPSAPRSIASAALAQPGQKVLVWTQPAPATLKAQRGDAGALAAALIQLQA